MEDADYHEYAEVQSGGDVYLTSPAVFSHGVQFPHAPRWSNRAIALQCRFLLDNAEHLLRMQVAIQEGPEDRLELMECVTQAILEEPLQLPSIDELESTMTRIRNQNHGEE